MLETISLEVVLNLMNAKIEPKVEEKKEEFVLENKNEPVVDLSKAENEVVEEGPGKVVVEENTTTAKDVKIDVSLNISDVDKDKEAAVDVEFEDVHTN